MDHTILVLDRTGRCIRSADHQFVELAHVALRDAPHLAAHRCAEEPRALGLRGVLQDLGEVLLETHVQHFVRFVQHHHVHGGKVQHGTADQVQQTAGRSHNDLRTALDVADLIADAGTAIHRHDAGAFQIGRIALQILADLHTEFAGRCQHQGLDGAVLRIQELQHGQAESGGLARTGLCQGHHVLLAFQQQRNGLFLNRCRGGEPDGFEGTEGLGA